MKKPVQFQASSSSQRRVSHYFYFFSALPAGAGRAHVAGSVSISLGSQSISKALKLRQRKGSGKHKAVHGGIISLLCCIMAVCAQHLCQESRLFLSLGQIYPGFDFSVAH